MVVRHQAVSIFSEEELGKFIGVKSIGRDHIEIECGCKSVKYGDIVGDLKIFGVKFTPAQFAKHAGKRMATNNWKNQIWVTNTRGRKICLWKTCLMKYHRESFLRPQRGLIVHRDEFIPCSLCKKERRFHLRDKEQCWIYHDALTNPKWKCSDMPSGRVKCEDEKERKSRKECRGCPARGKCNGCTRCVCLGCSMCRFGDCNCRSCVEFFTNENS
ncbi:hypothetical protein LguiA_035540 [Lonicera macranthoides]